MYQFVMIMLVYSQFQVKWLGHNKVC